MAETTTPPSTADPAEEPTRVRPPEIDKAAAHGDLTAKEEGDALEFLLGEPERLQFDLAMKMHTPAGERSLTVRIQQMDDSRLNEIDTDNRNPNDPLKFDEAGYAADVCAEAIVSLTGSTGRTVEVGSPEFRAGAVNASEALRGRFRWQSRLLMIVAQRVQEVSGGSADSVGTPRRVGGVAALVEAGKG